MSYDSLPILTRPKAQIADLVEREGIPVPRRYASFDEAMDGNGPVIARSEHPREFAGESGILDSFALTPEFVLKARGFDEPIGPEDEPGTFNASFRVSLRAVRARLQGGRDKELYAALASSAGAGRTLDEYCRLYGMDKHEFLAEVSYSYWQLLGGYNRTIIADDVVPGRYHIFTTNSADSIEEHNYAIIDDGDVRVSAGSGIEREMIVRGAAELVNFYERVRQLPFFDPQNCPFIECQLVNGVHHFLQYHVGRSFNPARFELTRDPHDDEVEMFFARGATPPEGLDVQAAFYYPHRAEVLTDQEEAAFDLNQNPVFHEIMSRRRQVQFISRRKSHGGIADKISNDHLSKSLLFKPRVSLAGHMKETRPKNIDDFFERTQRDRIPARFSTHVISDGRRAFMRKYKP